MKKWQLHLLAIVTMIAAAGLAIVIMVFFDGGYLGFVPPIVWFIWMQIFIVPKILK